MPRPAKKRRSKRISPASAPRVAGLPGGKGEHGAADGTTVGWLITAFAALVAEVLAGIGWLFGASAPPEAAPRVFLFPLAAFVALMTATLALALTPLVLMLRRVPPPRAITFAVVAIGAAPWLVVLWSWLFSTS